MVAGLDTLEPVLSLGRDVVPPSGSSGAANVSSGAGRFLDPPGTALAVLGMLAKLVGG